VTVSARLEPLLAEVVDGEFSLSTPLVGGGLGLDSLTGMRLLAAVRREFGVDVAAEDLALDCLETVGTLTLFLETALAARA
jgi:acyl carrier protein